MIASSAPCEMLVELGDRGVDVAGLEQVEQVVVGAGLVARVAAYPVDLGERQPQLGHDRLGHRRPAAVSRSARPG